MVRLVSNVENEIDLYAEGVNCLYAEMLKKYEVTCYRHYQIIHAEDNDQELIYYSGKEVSIKLKYDIGPDFKLKDDYAKQSVFVDIIHAALLKLASEDRCLDISVLDVIKAEALATRFDFEILYKQFLNKKFNDLEAKVIIKPAMRHLDIYIDIFQNASRIQRYLIYRGLPDTYYLRDFFSKGKWKGKKFVLTGDIAEIEFHVDSEAASLAFVIITSSGKAPTFEMLKANSDKEKTLKDYLHSLNPAIAAILTQSVN